MTPILTHGSDMSLAPTVGAVVRHHRCNVAAAVEHLSTLGFDAVQLDATLPGIRPRELDQRARKDLLALLTRRSMRLAGLDLFLPHRHYLDSAHVDRAMAATLASIELAVDLGRVPLSVALPVGELADDAKAAIVEAADGRGARLAVHAEDDVDALLEWIGQVDLPAIGCGLDPAAALGRGDDALRGAQALGARLHSARLCDVVSGGLRCPVGQGELDTIQYRIAVDLAAARLGPVVLDLRALDDPLGGAAVGKTEWEAAAWDH
ncbi:MAG: hypothetical protein CMJ18_21615 [Phycisphaeraceae bacterium]|nr:hypothetical protein [Phycisphaeraceae bacterium]